MGDRPSILLLHFRKKFLIESKIQGLGWEGWVSANLEPRPVLLSAVRETAVLTR